MSWTYVDTIPGVAAGGPNPSDAVTFAFKFATDTNAAPTDGASFALGFPESNASPSDGLNLGVGFGDSNAVPVDSLLGLRFIIPDTNSAPSDTATLAVASLFDDPNTSPTDALMLGFEFESDLNTAPFDTKTGTLRCWLSSSVQSAGVVTNPANANSANNGTLASMTTAVAGTNPVMTSACGVGIPAATAFTTAIYRGWFNAVLPLATSHCIIVCQSTSALFTDITMLDTTTALNHLTGTFTFDLAAAGVNTLAKLQSVRIVHKSTDAAAGVTPATFTVDAGCVELAGVV